MLETKHAQATSHAYLPFSLSFHIDSVQCRTANRHQGSRHRAGGRPFSLFYGTVAQHREQQAECASAAISGGPVAPAWVLVPRHCLRCQAWHSGSSSARACTAGADRRPTRLVGGEASCSAPLRPLARGGIDGGPQEWDWRRSNRLLAQDGERRARPAGGCAAAGAWPDRGIAHRTAVPACCAARGRGGIGQAQAKHWVKVPRPNGEGGEGGGAPACSGRGAPAG